MNPSKPIPVSAGKKALFVAMTVVFCLLSLEGVVRLIPTDRGPGPTVPAKVTQFDEQLGWSLKPSVSAVSSRTGYPIEYRINSKGLRDDETPYEKPAGVFRIVLLGDSWTFGFGVPIEKHFSKILEGYFESVDVINMGVSAYGIDQELMALQNEGFKYQPDLVIAYIVHYANHRHMHTRRFGREKPRFILKDGRLVLTHSPVLPREETFDPDPSATLTQKIRFRLYQFSKIYRILRDTYVRLVRPQEVSGSKFAKQKDTANFKNGVFRKELYDLGEAIVFEMERQSRQNHAQFVLITRIPELFAFANKKGTAVLDPGLSISNPYFPLPEDLAHLNEAGNGAFAWEIAQFLKARNLVPSRHLKIYKELRLE